MSEVPATFEVDVKIEQSAKGARVMVHCFGHSDEMTITRAIDAYKTTMQQLNFQGLPVAPIEVKS